jgi:hypothetical protein
VCAAIFAEEGIGDFFRGDFSGGAIQLH